MQELKISKKTVIYLVQKYSGIQMEAWRNAVNNVTLLRRLELTVFSPILHTHDYSLYLSNRELQKEDFVQWDLDLCEGFLNHDGDKLKINGYDSGLIMVFHPSAYTIQNIKEYNPINDNVFEYRRIKWHSEGCKKEFKWAQENMVKCLELIPLLDKITKEL